PNLRLRSTCFRIFGRHGRAQAWMRGCPDPIQFVKPLALIAGSTSMISLVDLQRRIDAGELSPDAAIAQSLEAIGGREKTIGAFVCHSATARAASAGPLRGIAVGIKDIIDTAEFPTEMGCPAIYGGLAAGGGAS